MKVKEWIEWLSNHDPEKEVELYMGDDDDGYYFKVEVLSRYTGDHGEAIIDLQDEPWEEPVQEPEVEVL